MEAKYSVGEPLVYAGSELVIVEFVLCDAYFHSEPVYRVRAGVEVWCCGESLLKGVEDAR